MAVGLGRPKTGMDSRLGLDEFKAGGGEAPV